MLFSWLFFSCSYLSGFEVFGVVKRTSMSPSVDLQRITMMTSEVSLLKTTSFVLKSRMSFSPILQSDTSSPRTKFTRRTLRLSAESGCERGSDWLCSGCSALFNMTGEQSLLFWVSTGISVCVAL